MQGFDAIQLTPVELGLSGCGENQFGIPELRWPASLAPENHTPQDAQKFQTSHPRPALAVISPSRPESAKTDSLPWDAPCPQQGRRRSKNRRRTLWGARCDE
jgi:hypothetical protein